MRKLVALITSLLIVAMISTPAHSNEPFYQVYQKTLATFTSDSTALTAQQKAQVKAAVEANPAAEKFICTGIRYFSQPMSVNIMVRKRAKAACEYAKELNPALSTWFQNKPTQARSFAGKVLLTVKSVEAEATFESYDSTRISKRAFDNVQKVLRANPVPSSTPNIIAGPSISAAQVELEKARLTNSIRFWSSIYSDPYDAYLYSGKDVDWLITQLEARGNPHWNDLIRSSYWKSTGKCAQSAANPQPGNNHFVHCIESNHADLRYSNIFAHEFAHLPLMTKALNQPSGLFSQLPIWLNEGAAQFFSISLTDQAGDPNSRYWHELHLNGSRDTVKLSTRSTPLTLVELLPTITSQETREFFRALESESALTTSHPYSLGTWATEVLVAIVGAEKFQDFLMTMSSRTSWESAFKTTYGLEVQDFYGKTATYLNWIGKSFAN